MPLLPHLVLGTEVCSLVVELLQGIHILADYCSMQVCGKLPFTLQGTQDTRFKALVDIQL